MEKKKYSDKLKDPRWQKLRLEVFDRDEWSCQKCGDSESTLAVHHLRYVPGWDPWDYPIEMLLTLCEGCHSIEYEMMPTAIGSLVEQIRDRGFLSADIQDIASGFNQLRLFHPPEVVATIIGFALGNKEIFRKISEMYFEYIKKENRKRKKEGK